MSALMEILGQSLGGDTMDQIGDQLGVDRETAQNAVGVALPILSGAQTHMEQNAPQGMDLVSQMLDSNHDGSVADDVTRMGVGLLGSLFNQRR